jgi:hypothetical protein
MPYVKSSSEPEISEDRPSEIEDSDEATPEDKNSETLISDFGSLEVAVGLGTSDVSVAESTVLVDVLDVEAGSVCLYDCNLPTSLPVCINQQWLDNWDLTICVYGGYVPVCGKIWLWQEKTDLSGCIDIDWSDAIDCGCPCGAVLYTATFSLSDGPIVFESNNMPIIDIPGIPPEDIVVVDAVNFDKMVSGCLCVAWTGCDFYTCCCLPQMDVQPGKIELCEVNFPDTLPICLTDEWLADKTVSLLVTGGYEPIDGTITLYQEGENKGTLSITWTSEPPIAPCGATKWTAHFAVEGPDNIILDSNHIPNICIPGCGPACGPDDLGKWVTLDIWTLWCGCLDADQQFQIIPAHKVLSRNPQLSIRVTSPVLT